MKIKINKHYVKAALVILAAAAIIAVLLLALGRIQDREDAAGRLSGGGDAEDAGQVFYNDKWYKPKAGLRTILLIGVDKFKNQLPNESYNNSQQADFLLLMVLDSENKVCRTFQLNRDTMTEINVLGLGGESTGTVTDQLALAHTYGSGGKDSCINTRKAVSDLLYGINIDDYIAFTMDAVPIINDAVGGVALTVNDDFSAVTDKLPVGSRVTLTGDLALTYIRARGEMQESTNLRRMDRQKQYLSALYDAYSNKSEENGSLVTDTRKELSGYIVSDCTVSELSGIYDTMRGCTLEIMDAPSGTAEQGREYVEFYPDQDELRAKVIDIFYEPAGR